MMTRVVLAVYLCLSVSLCPVWCSLGCCSACAAKSEQKSAAGNGSAPEQACCCCSECGSNANEPANEPHPAKPLEKQSNRQACQCICGGAVFEKRSEPIPSQQSVIVPPCEVVAIAAPQDIAFDWNRIDAPDFALVCSGRQLRTRHKSFLF